MPAVYDERPYEPYVPPIGAGGLPPVTKRFIVINVVLGVAGLLLGFTSPAMVESTYSWFGLDVQRWRDLFPFVPVWQLVSYGFLHDAGDPFHLLFNMLGLYFFGGMLEQLIGSRRFAWFYLASIAVTAVAQLAFSLSVGQELMVVGASGAVLFLLTAMAVLRPRLQVILLFVPMQLWVLATGYFLIQVYSLSRGGGHTAYLIHIVGAIFGAVSAKLGWLWFDPKQAWAERQERKAVSDRRSDEERLDELLAQIHREGIGSLSSSDREFLKRMSARRDG